MFGIGRAPARLNRRRIETGKWGSDSDIAKASMISSSAQTSGAMPVSRLSLKADLTVIESQSFTAS